MMGDESLMTRSLLLWFKENGRDLPWRHTKDPYAIWLSEVILQQTRIQQGWAYWERFMSRWPAVEALAAASEDEVLREWQGLGYYSRARNLHTAAKQIVSMGYFPNTLEEIKKLKGVGDYTAAAIGSIAFGLPVAVVDGNVYRVLSRYFGIDTPINTTEGKKEFATLAQSLLPASSSLASHFNQAMMDFGAIQCTPQSPDCLSCPLVETCEALRTGRVGQLPVKLKTLKVKTRHLTYVYVRWKGKTAIRRRGEGDIWQGLYEPVLIDDDAQIQNKSGYNSGLIADHWLSQHHCQLIAKGVKHVLTHRVILADFYLCEVDEKPELSANYIWINEEDIDTYAIPRLIEILLTKLNQ